MSVSDSILSVMSGNGPMTRAEICEKVNHSQASVKGAISRMVSIGTLNAKQDPNGYRKTCRVYFIASRKGCVIQRALERARNGAIESMKFTCNTR